MKELPIAAILSIVVGVILLIVPEFFVYLIAFYLILSGVLMIVKKK